MLTIAKRGVKPALVLLLTALVALAIFPAATTALVIVEQLPVGDDARPALSFATTAVMMSTGIAAIVIGAWFIAKRYQEKDV